MDLAAASTLHLLHHRVQGSSRHTLLAYEMVERRYIDWSSTQLERTPILADLTLASVNAYVLWLRTEHTDLSAFGGKARGHGANSIRQHVQVLKAWAGHLTDVEQLYPKGMPLRSLKTPASPKLEIARFTEPEIKRMLALCGDLRYPLRNVAILRLLLESGVRISELCSMEVADIEMATLRRSFGRAFVERGKGGKERTVLFGPKASQALQRYLAAGRERGAGPLFVAQGGRAISRAAVDKMIELVGTQAGIPRRKLHAHTFRHTFATQYLKRNPGQLLQLQQLLGHATLEMVQHYARLAQQDVEDSYISPFDAW